MPELPSLEEARLVIRNNQACYEDWYIAGAILCEQKVDACGPAGVPEAACGQMARGHVLQAHAAPKRTEAVMDPKLSRYLKAKGCGTSECRRPRPRERQSARKRRRVRRAVLGGGWTESWRVSVGTVECDRHSS
jgi:hypothetical protein